MNDQTIKGTGIFTWDGSERRTDRYGAFALVSRNYKGTAAVNVEWSQPIATLVGQRCRITARVIEARQSGHVGDLFRGIVPSQLEVGEEIDLGIGTLFDPDWEWAAGVGLKPDNERESDWLDPHKLYRLHDQTVEITITPVASGVSQSPASETEDPFPFTLGMVTIPESEAEGLVEVQFKGRRL